MDSRHGLPGPSSRSSTKSQSRSRAHPKPRTVPSIGGSRVSLAEARSRACHRGPCKFAVSARHP
jgi:hypothetical protein